jgi:serine phosphatase RsbU (regulator of sigma subunit)
VTLTNNYIAETHGESGMFATLFFGILDPRDGTLTYINGGHEPPLMIRAGKVSESLRKTGPAVGAILNGCFDALETHLNPGDMLFAFTDGAFEAKNPQDEFFGRKRLLDLFQGESGSSHELIRNIETALHQYIASATQFDDITLLAVRRD